MCLTPILAFKKGFETPFNIFTDFRPVFSLEKSADIGVCVRKHGNKPFYPSKFGLMELPCRRCPECRRAYTNEWADRIMVEASRHAENSFITLTYDEASYPGHLVLRDLQLFFKRLRKALFPLKIRYYAVGEYGKKTCRAHYHIALFGWYPEDSYVFFRKNGVDTCLSEFLSSVWQKGHITVQALTIESSRYVAKYMHKLFPVRCQAEIDYPPFSVMSRRPGIGLPLIDLASASAQEIFDTVQKGMPSVGGRVRQLPQSWRLKAVKRLKELFAVVFLCRLYAESERRVEIFERDLSARRRKNVLILDKIRVADRHFKDVL